ncbi:hypothetical protein MKW98_027910 [Papaver atlanticum]|uniref:Uncharacterized protein n=1 Tax=Papaver atlanticum TaxID=357466 RepID=A0AAD4XAS1_9MAGN|nr:hypothetical protein MKW98_027910 [Papaver atlanticum]
MVNVVSDSEDSKDDPLYDIASDNDESHGIPVTTYNSEGSQTNMHTNVRHSLKHMDVKCTHCGALHWMDERLMKSSRKKPKFGTCCLEGKIKLPPLQVPPKELMELYEGNGYLARLFRSKIRR